MKLKEQLHKIVVESDSKRGRIFDLFIQALILLSLITFSIETLPDLHDYHKRQLRWFEIFSVTVFTIEYVLRLWLTKPTKAYAFSFFGIVDLLAILPFYISSGVDLRSIRVFRLLRLFRVFKLFKYNTAIARLSNAFSSIKKELTVFMVGTIFLLYVSAVGIYYFENPVQPESFTSVFHCMWWAVTTLTTVGYGDMYPITAGGKLFSTVVVFIGMGIVAIPTGLLASAFSQTFKDNIPDQ
ncbi:MAG TPA: ion transporter [Flavobacteriales bacterium]|nr:ion transporter [Flavobacteriales bacterium]